MFSNVPRLLLVTALLTILGIGITATNTPSMGKIPLSLPLAAVNGPQSTIVILVRFSDQPNTTRPSQISAILSTMNNYYAEDSYGTTSFATTLAPNGPAWFLLPNPMTYYGANTASSDNQLVDDGLRAASDSGINLAQFKFASIVHAGSDQAMTHAISDIHSFTIQGYVFSTGPLTSIKISTSVVAESDPVGVFAHESGHLLGLPDLYDITGRIDPSNNFLGYWEIMALGEWNPNNGLPPPAGTYPALHSSWSKIQLGWLQDPNPEQKCGPGISGVCIVQSGAAANITLQNLEEVSTGIQGVKLPIAYNRDGTMTYYLIEMRSKLGTYDKYLPFPSDYPGAGLLVYDVNESITPGHGSIRIIDAHPGGSLDDAPFGPCVAPCVSQNTFSDPTNFVKVIVTSTSSTAYSITVDRTSAPALLLQVSISPVSRGVLISVDGTNSSSDSTGQVRLSLKYGPHTLFVQPSIPLSVGSTSVSVGLTNGFSAWDDGSTANPRGLSLVSDTVLTAIYHVTIVPSSSIAIVAIGALALILAGVGLHRHRSRRAKVVVMQTVQVPLQQPSSGSLPSSSRNRNSSILEG